MYKAKCLIRRPTIDYQITSLGLIIIIIGVNLRA